MTKTATMLLAKLHSNRAAYQYLGIESYADGSRKYHAACELVASGAAVLVRKSTDHIMIRKNGYTRAVPSCSILITLPDAEKK